MATGSRWALAATLLAVPAMGPWWIWPLLRHANASTGGDVLVASLLYVAVLAPALFGAAGLAWPAAARWLWGAAVVIIAVAMGQIVASVGWRLGDWTWAYLVLPALVGGMFGMAIHGSRAGVAGMK